MKYDHIISASEALTEKPFHLSCGFYETTSFFFEKANFSVVIHCRGEFTFYDGEGTVVKTVKAKPMTGGRSCYMDVFITTTDDGALFRLPDYIWYDNYPDCDGESDRWDTKIIGIMDEIRYPAD